MEVDVDVEVERGAEAMDEGDRTGARIQPCARAVRTQVPLDLVEEDAQREIERFAVVLQVRTQPFGMRQDP